MFAKSPAEDALFTPTLQTNLTGHGFFVSPRAPREAGSEQDHCSERGRLLTSARSNAISSLSEKPDSNYANVAIYRLCVGSASRSYTMRIGLDHHASFGARVGLHRVLVRTPPATRTKPSRKTCGAWLFCVLAYRVQQSGRHFASQNRSSAAHGVREKCGAWLFRFFRASIIFDDTLLFISPAAEHTGRIASCHRSEKRAPFFIRFMTIRPLCYHRFKR